MDGWMEATRYLATGPTCLTSSRISDRLSMMQRVLIRNDWRMREAFETVVRTYGTRIRPFVVDPVKWRQMGLLERQRWLLVPRIVPRGLPPRPKFMSGAKRTYEYTMS